jgi:ABC-type transporter Mla MlaB component
MALFSKPPLKKPAPPAAPASRPASKSAARPAVSAREVAAQAAGQKARPAARHEPGDVSVTGASIIDWSSTTPAPIEVAQANPGLCTVLENAALMYASGQPAAARSLLEEGVVGDEDTKLSALAWLALFDLLQRAGDRAAFDQLALQYVVQFERSAPAWDDQGAQASAGIARPTSGGYVAVTGRLGGDGFGPLEGLRRALDKKVPRARVDLSQVSEFDDAGASALADLLARARHQKLECSLQRPEKLRAAVESAVARGKDGGEGAWLLSMELMQWQQAHAAFEERALEFAMAFERSPPSWEPPPVVEADPDAARNEAADAAADAEASGVPAGDNGILRWSGVLTGSAQRQLGQLADFALSRPVLTVDLAAVERIDFVCAGALLNAINRIEGQRKVVQLAGASPIIRALLLLIGISPRHFIRQAA